MITGSTTVVESILNIERKKFTSDENKLLEKGTTSQQKGKESRVGKRAAALTTRLLLLSTSAQESGEATRGAGSCGENADRKEKYVRSRLFHACRKQSGSETPPFCYVDYKDSFFSPTLYSTLPCPLLPNHSFFFFFSFHLRLEHIIRVH